MVGMGLDVDGGMNRVRGREVEWILRLRLAPRLVVLFLILL